MKKNKLAKAAESFREEFDPHYNEIVAVGIGNKELCIYLKTKKLLKKLPDEYQGFPVRKMVTGEFRLAAAT